MIVHVHQKRTTSVSIVLDYQIAWITQDNLRSLAIWWKKVRPARMLVFCKKNGFARMFSNFPDLRNKYWAKKMVISLKNEAYFRQNEMTQKNLKEILDFNLFICRKQN